MNGSAHLQLNSGMMLLRPDRGTFRRIRDTQLTVSAADLNISCRDKRSDLRGDQRLLAYHFEVRERVAFHALPSCFQDLRGKRGGDASGIDPYDGKTCAFHADVLTPDFRRFDLHDSWIQRIPSHKGRAIACEWRRHYLHAESKLHDALLSVPGLPCCSI